MMKIDRKLFFDRLRSSKLFNGQLTQEQVRGMEAVIDEWERGVYGTDLAHLAYAFVTAYHETDTRMYPIEEYGKGAGKKYGAAYGRGFVMITWQANYRKFAKLLGIPLDTNYSLALDLRTSAAILLLGMTGGHFRNRKLSDYDFTTNQGVIDARDIINPDADYTDAKSLKQGFATRGDMIASYFMPFMTALTCQEDTVPVNAPDNSVVVQEPDFSDHPKATAPDDFDALPELPPEYYAWLAEARKQKQAQAYRELNNKPLVSSLVAKAVIAGAFGWLTVKFGINIPPEFQTTAEAAVLSIAASLALRGRWQATTFINGIFKGRTP